MHGNVGGEKALFHLAGQKKAQTYRLPIKVPSSLTVDPS